MSPKGSGDDEKGFAGRWSRLKQESRNPLPPLEKETDAGLPDAAEQSTDQRSDEEILEALGLPDPDTLTAGDDFSAFMAKTVPAKLRSRALRKLWISNPVLANLDGMVDYGGDFTDAATVIENLATGYQVGKGWAEKIIQTPKPLFPKDDEDETQAAEAETDVAATPSGETEPVLDDEPADEAVVETDAKNLAETPVAPQQFRTKRRMQFRVAED